MKLDFYQTFAYLADEHPHAWPAGPAACDPVLAAATIDRSLEQCDAALEAGFDSLTMAEHHYSPKQLSPNPIIYAAIAAKRFPGVELGVFGTDLPINNPVRIAEEYAQLDVLTGGRLRVGLLRGTPNEYLTYYDNPWESRERLEEGALLIQACWTEPEPFGWEGRYYRYRNIAVWPRVMQQPHPRILISGNSPDGAVFAGRNRFDIGFSYMAAAKCAENLELYRRTAAEHGWEPGAENIQYRHWIWVDETDELAIEANARYAGAGLLALFAGASPDMMKAIGTCAAAGAGVGRGVPDTSGLAFPEGPPRMPPGGMVPGAPFVGNPDTVLAQIAEVHEILAPGRLELHIGLPMTPIPHEETMRNIDLLGREVLGEAKAEAW
jgi:alkanesulfonate monooxygenase SsuD/methylene tetrahydromethanopterin reductase-like flavin-dependent oxidoreductase (luciferase family)